MARKFKRYNNGIENIIVYEGDPVPEGYVKGMIVSEEVKRSRAEKARKTNLERYGVANAMQSKEIVDKLKNSNLEKYGATCTLHSKVVEEKTKQTNLERYGTEHYFQSEEFKGKYKQIMQDKYCVDNSFQAEEVKEKIKEVNKKNLGVEYPMLSKEVQEKSKQTSLSKYGTEYPNQSDIVKENIIKASLKKYGVEHPAQSDIVKEKALQTNMTKYGGKASTSSKVTLGKIKRTNEEKYGVPWACMRPEARNYSNDSIPNKDFADLLDTNNIKYEREFPIGKYSYDFKVNNILIEIDPYATHNSLWNPFGRDGLSKDYHQKKSQTAEAEGYQVIHIFDWDDINKIVNLLKTKEKVYARKCKVSDVSQDDMIKFENDNHLQGYCKGQEVCIGLYYNNKLTSLMSFGKPRYNKNYQWELLRYCSSKAVIGGAEKLFKHFIKIYSPESIISYCDRSKFKGEVYTKIGFTLKLEGSPSCHWYSPKEDKHITDNLLRARGFDQLFNTNYGKGTNNKELIIQEGYLPIYDCGQAVYEWRNKR